MRFKAFSETAILHNIDLLQAKSSILRSRVAEDQKGRGLTVIQDAI